LALLDPDSGLERVMIEDLTPIPPEGMSSELLLGVDLTEFYGGVDLTSAQRIVVSQLKYSQRHPTRTWTAARLAEDGSRGQKGALARLADVYGAISQTRTREEVLKQLEIRLVSNRPASAGLAGAITASKRWLAEHPDQARRAELLKAIGPSAGKEIARLSKASGLQSVAFTDFLRVLEIGYMGVGSRAEQELAITETLTGHVFEEVRYASLKLARLIEQRALPEGEAAPVERSDVLAALDVHSETDLLPAPPRLTRAANPVPTLDAERILAALDAAPDRRVLAHGAAGVGKTTSILALQDVLPKGSVVLTYDCFGEGDYEVRGCARHVELRFGMQMCNSLAARARLPMIIRPPRGPHDLWRELERRLRLAGEVLSQQGARLILVIDAADNSAWAGRHFAEDTFLRGLWSQPLPPGTGLIVTCRTHRRHELEPPEDIAQVQLRGFDLGCSAQYLRERFPQASDAQALEFHERSAGNPRVQFYVLFQKRAEAVRTLDEAIAQAQTTPTDIFESLLKAAVTQVPSPGRARESLAELICLTKPLTSARFRRVSGLAAARVRDFCESLEPGLVIDGDELAFRDEDFANFLREKVGEQEQRDAHSRLADLFLTQQQDPESAAALADHLLGAGRETELIALALNGGPPEAIADPLARQQVYSRRLTLAMRHAAAQAERQSSCRLLVLAGEAARQNRAVAEVLRRRPDLGMRHGDPEAVMRVYAEATSPDWRGPVHMQLAAMYARAGEHDRARVDAQQAWAWVQRRAEQEETWELKPDDLAAYAEAYFHVLGPDAAVEQLRRWRPEGFVADAAVALVRRLARSVPGVVLGGLIAAQELPASMRARLLASAFAAGARPSRAQVELVAQALVAQAPDISEGDGWWAASFVELAAVTRLRRAAVLELTGILAPPRARRSPPRYGGLGSYRDMLRIAALRAACAKAELDMEDLMPTSVTEPGDDTPQADIDSERSATHEQLKRYLSVFAERARAMLTRPDITKLRTEFAARFTGQAEDRRARGERDYGQRMCIAAFTDALLACRGSDVELIRSAADRHSDDFACLMSIARRLVLDERYAEEGLRILETAASLIESREMPASEQADCLLEACGVADQLDGAHARDLHARAVRAAEGMDDDGVGRLAMHARIAAQLTGTSRATLAWRMSQALLAHRLRVSDEEQLPWRETLRAATMLDPPTGLLLIARWEHEGHLLLRSSIDAAAPALAQTGLLEPRQTLSLLLLAGEDSDPVTPAIAILELIEAGPEQKAAMDELSLRIRRDMHSSARQWAAQSLSEWASGSGLGELEAIRALAPLASEEHEQSRSRAWLGTEGEWKEQRERTVKRVFAHAEKGDLTKLEPDLLTLQEHGGAQEIAGYLTKVAETVLPSRRAELAAALGALPGDEKLTPQAEKMLDALAGMVDRWKGSTVAREACVEAIEKLVEKHFQALVRYQGRGAENGAKLLALDCLKDPAGLVLRGVAANLERLSPLALYETAAELTLTLEDSERAEVLDWSLGELDGEHAPAPELPAERDDLIAGFLFSLMAAPDKATRWRAAHLARALLTDGSESLSVALLQRATSPRDDAFGAPGRPFYWHSGREWALMTIARVAQEHPAKVKALAPTLASIALDRDWPHASVREFARVGALSIAAAISGALEEDTVAELEFANAPRACSVKRERHAYRTGGGHRDYDTERYHFDPIDTLPYVYGPFGDRFGLSVDEVCDRAECWILDRLGATGERVDDPRVTRMDYAMRDHSHGTSPRVESWRHALEHHALALVAGELCDEGAEVIVDFYEDAPDPWQEWLSEHLDSGERGWMIDRREPVQPTPSLLMSDISNGEWPELTDTDVESLIDAHDPEWLTVDANITLAARFGFGSNYVTSALVSPKTAPALVRALQSAEDPRVFALPVEHGNWENQESIEQGEFRLIGWLWEDHHESDNLERHDPLARVRRHVTRPGTLFLQSTGGMLDAEGWRVLGPDGTLLAVQHAFSDIQMTDDRRPEPDGASGRATHVRRAALQQMLTDTGLLLLVRAIAIHHRSSHYRKQEEEENSEKHIHGVYLFDADGRLKGLGEAR
jgi:hypothetical protein